MLTKYSWRLLALVLWSKIYLLLRVRCFGSELLNNLPFAITFFIICQAFFVCYLCDEVSSFSNIKSLRILKLSESCMYMLMPPPLPPFDHFSEKYSYVDGQLCIVAVGKLSLIPSSNQVSVKHRTSEKNLFERETPWVFQKFSWYLFF